MVGIFFSCTIRDTFASVLRFWTRTVLFTCGWREVGLFCSLHVRLVLDVGSGATHGHLLSYVVIRAPWLSFAFGLISAPFEEGRGDKPLGIGSWGRE